MTWSSGQYTPLMLTPLQVPPKGSSEMAFGVCLRFRVRCSSLCKKNKISFSSDQYQPQKFLFNMPLKLNIVLKAWSKRPPHAPVKMTVEAGYLSSII